MAWKISPENNREDHGLIQYLSPAGFATNPPSVHGTLWRIAVILELVDGLDVPDGYDVLRLSRGCKSTSVVHPTAQPLNLI